MFELIERTGETRATPATFQTFEEGASALGRRAAELRRAYGDATVTAVLPRFVVALHDQGITVSCLRKSA